MVGAGAINPSEERWRSAINGEIRGSGVAPHLTLSATVETADDFSLSDRPSSGVVAYLTIGRERGKVKESDRCTLDMTVHSLTLGGSDAVLTDRPSSPRRVNLTAAGGG